LLERLVDLYGYVSVDTNRYSVPERLVGKSVAVYKLPAEIRVCRKDTTIAVHPRMIAQRNAKSTLPGHHTIPLRQGRGTATEEKLLSGHHPSLDRYVDAIRQRGNAGGRRALRRLVEMKRTYPAGPFIAAIEQAPAVWPVRPRPAGRPDPQTSRRRLLRAEHRERRRCMTSCAR
jgi:hypothetical protein